MVNLWPGIPAKCLCDKHLNAVLAEYNNLLIPSMRKGNSISGYIKHGCIDLPNTKSRILECLEESVDRGFGWKHHATLEDFTLLQQYTVRYKNEFPEIFDESRRMEMSKMNKAVLSFRCKDCRERIKNDR